VAATTLEHLNSAPPFTATRRDLAIPFDETKRRSSRCGFSGFFSRIE
jgi:hypothetical protein